MREHSPVNCSLISKYAYMYTYMHTQYESEHITQKPLEQLKILYTDMSSTAQLSKVDELKKSKSNNGT